MLLRRRGAATAEPHHVLAVDHVGRRRGDGQVFFGECAEPLGTLRQLARKRGQLAHRRFRRDGTGSAGSRLARPPLRPKAARYARWPSVASPGRSCGLLPALARASSAPRREGLLQPPQLAFELLDLAEGVVHVSARRHVHAPCSRGRSPSAAAGGARWRRGSALPSRAGRPALHRVVHRSVDRLGPQADEGEQRLDTLAAPPIACSSAQSLRAFDQACAAIARYSAWERCLAMPAVSISRQACCSWRTGRDPKASPRPPKVRSIPSCNWCRAPAAYSPGTGAEQRWPGADIGWPPAAATAGASRFGRRAVDGRCRTVNAERLRRQTRPCARAAERLIQLRQHALEDARAPCHLLGRKRCRGAIRRGRAAPAGRASRPE